MTYCAIVSGHDYSVAPTWVDAITKAKGTKCTECFFVHVTAPSIAAAKAALDRAEYQVIAKEILREDKE